MSAPPQDVLSDAFRKAIDGCEVKAAVFTTFALEWAFFVDEILPAFVPHSLAASKNYRREELAEYFSRTGAALTVFHDQGHIEDRQGASRVPLDVQSVRHRTGVFHPKVTLALVKNDGVERLVVAAGSANLTQAGWFESVECAHITSIDAHAMTWLRDDLLAFVEHLRKQEKHQPKVATGRIRDFLTATKQRHHRSVRDANGLERFVWNGIGGRKGLIDEIELMIGKDYQGGTTEIISPWFSERGDDVLRELTARAGTRRTLTLAPVDVDGRALLPEAAVRRLGDGVEWAALDNAVTRSGRTAESAPRHLHAKAYRFTKAQDGRQTLVVGSFNLTKEAFAPAGNLEAGFLIELPTGGRKLWLSPHELPTSFHATVPEEEAENLPNSQLAPMTLSYTWRDGPAQVGWTGLDPCPVELAIRQGAVPILTVRAAQVPGQLDDEQTAALRQHLTSSSPILDVFGPLGEQLGYVIVHELDVGSKPSSDAERGISESVAELLLGAEALRNRQLRGRSRDDDGDEDQDGEAEPKDDDDEEAAQPTIFDGNAALFQAMSALERDVTQLLVDKHDHEVEYRLSKEGSRCLGDLTTAAQRTATQDPARALVVCWAIEDVLRALKPIVRPRIHGLEVIEPRVAELRATLEKRLIEENPEDPEFARFLMWARRSFVRQSP